MIKIISLLTVAFIIFSNTCFAQISIDSLKKNLYYMAADSNDGRYGGTRVMERVADYIADKFKESGIKPFGKDYFQVFPLAPNYGKNIIGVIEGSDPILKDEYIVLGAHYDHIGWYMKNDSTKIVFNGADDNASGTCGIIEIGRNLAKNKQLLKRSILIVAFDGEELGLRGSSYFIRHPDIKLEKIKAMFSIDMIGALDKGKKMTFSGCGSFYEGTEFMKSIRKVDSLAVEFIPSSLLWRNMTDTKPFYDSAITCMYVSTGLKSPYHKPEDDADSIDFKGMTLVCQQIYIATVELANKKDFAFSETHEPIRVINKPFKIGISLNYNSNYHYYTEGPYLAKSLLGFGGGLFSYIKLSKLYALKPEINYSYYGTENAGGKIRLSTIDVPLSLLFGNFSEENGTAYIQFGGYYNYSFYGTIGGNKIDWDKQNFNKKDYGIQGGFGLEVFNLQICFNAKTGLSNFFKGNIPGFGIARNATSTFSVGYYFLP